MRKKEIPYPLPEELTKEELTEHLQSHLEFKRTWTDSVADMLTQKLGSTTFLLCNMFFFVGWVVINSGVTSIEPFDPFPFILLTMIVSLEAIFLAIIVLMSQNRQSRIADVRQKLDFEIDVRAEEEVTKILMMLEQIHEKMGIADDADEELTRMKRRIDWKTLEKEAEE